MVQEIRSLQKLAIFFRVSRGGGGGGACTRYFTVYNINISEGSFSWKLTHIQDNIILVVPMHICIAHSIL